MKNKISMNLEVSLIEIVISILIFAVAGAIMLNCFAAARFTQIKANDKVSAGSIIQSNAEMIKSFDNTNDLNKYLTENFNIQKNSLYINYYDDNWNICDQQSKKYLITVNVSDIPTNSGDLKKITITAGRDKPYPFIDKNKEIDSIYEIETKKFFPSYDGGR